MLPLFLASFSNLQVIMKCMRARRSSKFGAIRRQTTELHVAALVRKNPYRIIINGEKRRCHPFSAILDQIIFILACKDDLHKSLPMDEFEIRPEPSPDHRVTCP